MPNYYPPATSAGGGTPDDNSVTSAKIVDGAIVNADINAAAAIAYSKLALTGAVLNADLAGSIAPAKITGTAVTAADTGTVTSTMITDGTIVTGDLNAAAGITSGQLAGSIAASKITGTALVATNNLSDVTVATARTNLGITTSAYSFGGNTYANFYPSLATATNAIAGSAGNARFVRITMPATGTLHDINFSYGSTSTGNYNILVLDDGQANATHTTRTCLYIKGATAATGASTWAPGDASLAVTVGDTLVFAVTSSETTSTMAMVNGIGLTDNLPTSFFPGSGASTASQKLCGTIASANVPGAVNGTVTDANLTVALACPLVVFRIT